MTMLLLLLVSIFALVASDVSHLQSQKEDNLRPAVKPFTFTYTAAGRHPTHADKQHLADSDNSGVFDELAGGVTKSSRTIEPGAVVANGAMIHRNALVRGGAVIAADAIVATGGEVGGGAVVGREAVVGPGAKVGPGAVMGIRSMLGPGAELRAGQVLTNGAVWL